MKVLDLFSGLGGWSQAFIDRGHEVVTVDIEPKFNPTIVADIINLKSNDFNHGSRIFDQKQHLTSPYDIILASPPCNCFSIASITSNWHKGRLPKENTKKAIRLVVHTIDLIVNLYPKWWILENPVGMLRKIIGMPTTTITTCQYGSNRMKPTDLWGVHPKGFISKRCKNRDSCHESTPRGAKTGTQGLKTKELRAKLPYGLSLAVCLACEKVLQK